MFNQKTWVENQLVRYWHDNKQGQGKFKGYATEWLPPFGRRLIIEDENMRSDHYPFATFTIFECNVEAIRSDENYRGPQFNDNMVPA